MGSADNITDSTFENIAKEKKSSVQNLKQNVRASLEKGEPTYMEAAFQKAASAWGQSVEEAKKNTLKLLRRQ